MDLRAWKVLMTGLEPDGVDCHSYSPALGNGNTVEFETSLLLFSLVRRFHPSTICDTGTHFGVATACMALALKDNWLDYKHKPKGYVYTIDSTDYPQNEQLWKELGVEDFVRKAVGDSRQATPPQNIDFLFLDSDHATQHIIVEWERFAPNLNRQQAIVLNHDTRLDSRSGAAFPLIYDGHLPPIPDYKMVSFMPIRNMRGLDLLFLSNGEL